MTKSNHNKYVSYPDWFGSSTSQPTQQQQVTQTVYYGGGGSSSDSGGTGLTGVITQGSGNAVTSGTLDGNTLVLNKDLTFATDQSNTNSFWELREDLNGKPYLYANYDIATLGGHTMYVDGDDTLSLPELYDGIPIDNITIYWDTDKNGNKVLKSVGISSGSGGVADKIAWANVYGKPSWITNDKPVYDYSEIQNVPDLSGFVTIEGYQEVKGVKNFLNGIQIADLPITKLNGYEDVIYIDSNVVVRGGLTMYYEGGDINLPSIIDEIGIAGYDGKKLGLVSFNSEQFAIDANGTVSVTVSGGGGTGLDVQQLQQYLDSKKYVTEPWVNAQGFVSQTTFQSLQNNLNAVINTVQSISNTLPTKADKSYVDSTFVTIKGTEDVTGLHNFTNGIKIGGVKISKTTDDIVYIEGNLVVKGGVTMYAIDDVTVDSILESLPIASTSNAGIAKFNPNQFTVDKNGLVTVLGDIGGGLNEDQLDDYLATKGYFLTSSFNKANIKSTLGISDWALATSKPSYTFSEIGSKPTTLSGYGITDAKISNGVITLGSNTIAPLTSHQTIYNLTFQSGSFSAVTFDPNGANKTVNIPTNTNQLTNGAGFITESSDITGNAATATTASKLSTVSKTAWGQTYWTSGGIPTSISGSLSSVTDITMTGSIKMNNGTTLQAKNSSGSYETIFWPRWTDNNTYLNFGSGGNFYIRNNSSTACLTIKSNGNILVAGGITMYSDERKKTILKDVELTLSQIANAPLIEHYYNSDENKTTHVSTIAQYWAGLNDWFCKKDDEGYYTMELQNAALASAISIARELTKYESKTDKKIRVLKERIIELENELNKLKGGIYGSN